MISSTCACFRLKSNGNWEKRTEGRLFELLRCFTSLWFLGKAEHAKIVQIQKKKKKRRQTPHCPCPTQSQALKEDYSANTYIVWIVWIKCLVGFLSHWPGFIRLVTKLLSQLHCVWPGVYFFRSSFQVILIKVWLWLTLVSFHFSPLVSWRNNHQRTVLLWVCPCSYLIFQWFLSILKKERVESREKAKTVPWQTCWASPWELLAFLGCVWSWCQSKAVWLAFPPPPSSPWGKICWRFVGVFLIQPVVTDTNPAAGSSTSKTSCTHLTF